MQRNTLPGQHGHLDTAISIACNDRIPIETNLSEAGATSALSSVHSADKTRDTFVKRRHISGASITNI